MYFQQNTNDWTITKGKNTPSSKKYPVKICKQEDFGKTANDKEFFE